LIEADSVAQEDKVRDQLAALVESDDRINERHRAVLLKWLALHRTQPVHDARLIMERRAALQRRPGVL
jgi:hypothetical protein